MTDPRKDPITAELHASPSYLAADEAVLFTVCNGCGAAGKIDLVPDTIYGLSMKPACFIHDWDYHHGKTEGDKRRADERFLLNMLKIIEARSQNAAIRSLRSMRAIKYYSAVRDFGKRAFWANKGQPNET